MKKTFQNKRDEVEYLLKKQKIRCIEDLDSYKLSICHPNSTGIDIGSRDIYVALPPLRAAELGIAIVHKFAIHTNDLIACGIDTVSIQNLAH